MIDANNTNYKNLVDSQNKKIVELSKQYKKWYNYFRRKKILKEINDFTVSRNNIFKEWREYTRKNNPDLLISSTGDKN